jgi:hypothetical protein
LPSASWRTQTASSEVAITPQAQCFYEFTIYTGRRKGVRTKSATQRGSSRQKALRFETLEPRYVLDSTVVFNEIMYHPRGDEAALEWVELYNQLSTPIDLSGWRITGGIDYRFAEGTSLRGGQYLVVASSPLHLQAAAGISNVVGPFSGSLSNSGELLEIRDRNDRIMDAIDYRDRGPWPVAPDGGGASLSKRASSLPSEPESNWTFSTVIGGSPGTESLDHQDLVSTAIPFGSNWKYHDAGIDLGTVWRQPGFDDSGWSSGSSLFYDAGGPAPLPKQTQLNPGSNTYYFRTTFQVDGNPADVRELSINAIVDDGAVFYLNGVEVYRLNLPNGTISFATGAVSDVGSAGPTGPIVIPAANLAAGTNVLAVEVHQSAPGASSTVAYYRFEEASGSSIVDTVSGVTHGQLIGGTRTGDVPGATVLQTGAPNLASANLVSSRAVINGQPFLFHDPSAGGVAGDATLEWYMKVPAADNHSAIFWSNTGPDDANRFNIFWNAEFTGQPNSDRSISGDFHTNANGHSDIGNHANGVPLALNQWHHVAIVRVDNTPSNPGDANFTWQWYLNGQLSPGHTKTTTTPLPTANNGWLIAGRQGGNSQGADILIDEIRLSRGALPPSKFLNSSMTAPAAPDTLFGTELRMTRDAQPVSVAFNEVSAPGPGFQVELVNHGATPVNLAGFVLTRSRASTETDFALPAQTLVPGQFVSFNVTQLGFVPAAGDKLFLLSANKTIIIDAVEVTTRLRGRLTSGIGDWYFPSLATFGAANHFDLRNEIVINEVMYHHQVLPDVGGTVVESPEEWIEFYIRGTAVVDLSGWSLSEAVDYVFPPGTSLGPGEYLVVASNAAQLQSQHPNITVLGNFARNLSNSGDHIVLLDARGNIADEIQYYDDKPWPSFADGGGSSLELRDPYSDNSRPEAWAASDESVAAQWRTYTYRGIAGPADSGSPQYHEFVMGLLGEGSLLLDDISVIEDPNGLRREVIQNGTFESGTTTKWRIIGNHHGTVVADPANAANRVLQLVATGRTDDMHNHVETTLKVGSSFVPIVAGREYEISYRAKWLGGSNLLNTRLFFSRLQETTRLEVPQSNGTPGRANSRLEDNIGPTFSALQHGPVVPAASQPVSISVAVADPQGVASAQLHWRRDGQPWSTVPMSVGADGRYFAAIAGQTAGARVQFYVQAADGLNAISRFPAAGEESRALYVVEDGRAQIGSLHNIRIIMTGADRALLDDGTNLMSNDLLGATVIINESAVHYDVGVRRSGAASSRQGVHGFHIEFNDDQRYSGVHETITVDRNHNEEIFVRHLINHAGDIPGMYNDVIYFVGPSTDRTGYAQLRMAGFDDIYLESQFPGDSDGPQFEKELTYRQQLSNSADVESLKVPFGYSHPTELNTDIANRGADPESYRWHWLAKNGRDVDDYTGIVALNQAFSLSGQALDAATGEIIDTDQWLRAFAAIRLLGNRDFYSQPKSTGANDSWRHNFWAYQRPSDGRFVLMPWDIDENFQVAFNDPSIFGTDNAAKFIQLPNNLHYYWGHFDDLINTTFNSQYMSTWASQYSTLLGGRNFAADQGYIVNRANYIRSRMPAVVPFRIESSQVPAQVNATSVRVDGQGWINVREIRVAGQARPLDVTWTSPTAWWADVPLQPGVNELAFVAYDFQGRPIDTPFINAVSVVSNVTLRPYQDFLQITEIMYHPSDPSAAEIAAGFTNAEDFEFLEFYNSSTTQTLDLSGVRITSGPSSEFNFAGGSVTSLGPGQFVLVVANKAAFEARYGTLLSHQIAGAYTGRLDNAGELIVVIDPAGDDIHRFNYSDDPPWPTAADGNGPSLVLRHPLHNPDHALSTNWTVSGAVDGSPGAADPADTPAVDFNQDLAVDAADYVLWRKSVGSSIDLRADANGDGAIDLSDYGLWRANFGIGISAAVSQSPQYSEATEHYRVALDMQVAQNVADSAAIASQAPVPKNKVSDEARRLAFAAVGEQPIRHKPIGRVIRLEHFVHVPQSARMIDTLLTELSDDEKRGAAALKWKLMRSSIAEGKPLNSETVSSLEELILDATLGRKLIISNQG